MTACNICGHAGNEIEFVACNTHGRHLVNANEKFEYRRCGECGNVFLAGVDADEEFFRRHYGADYYSGSTGENSCLAAIGNMYGTMCFRRKARLIGRSLGTRNERIRILDVGCGSGAFLESLNPTVFDKAGLEINPRGAEICRQKGIRIYGQDVRNVEFGPQKFDAVTLWHVLEHTSDPVSILKRIREILDRNGIVAVSVPNTGSLGFRFGREWWFHVDAPRHLFLPDETSMRRLFDEAGLTVVGKFPMALEYPLDLLWSVRRSALRFAIYPLYPVFKMFSVETLTFVARSC